MPSVRKNKNFQKPHPGTLRLVKKLRLEVGKPGATVAGIARKVHRDKSYLYKLFLRFDISMPTSGMERSLAALKKSGGYKATRERIVKAKKEAANPKNTITKICRKLRVAPITFRAWRERYHIKVASQQKRP